MSKEKFLPAYEGSMRQDLMEMARRESGVTSPDIITELPPRGGGRPRIGAPRAPRVERPLRGRSLKNEAKRVRKSTSTEAARDHLHQTGHGRMRTATEAGVAIATVYGVTHAEVVTYWFTNGLAYIGLNALGGGAAYLMLFAASQMVPFIGGLTQWLSKKMIKVIGRSTLGYISPRAYKWVNDKIFERKHQVDQWMHDNLPKPLRAVYFFYKHANGFISDLLDTKFKRAFMGDIPAMFSFEAQDRLLAEDADEIEKAKESRAAIAKAGEEAESNFHDHQRKLEEGVAK